MPCIPWHSFFAINLKISTMIEKRNESTVNRPFGERPIDAPAVSIDIPAYAQQIKDEEAWKKNDRNAITVFKTEGMTIVLVALHSGAEVAKKASEGIMSIHLLEGEIKIETENEPVTLEKEHVFAIHKGQPYSLNALKESVFLLTMVNPD